MAVWQVAQFTIRSLRRLGMVDVCFIGGAACSLYANQRQPKVSPITHIPLIFS
jgi:hypothetical protein